MTMMTTTTGPPPVAIPNLTAGRDVDSLCLQDLFVEQAAKTPDAVAVIDESDRQLTYGQLDAVTDALAARLHSQEHKVRPDSVVGILLPRSIEYVVAYVAILKAGGAYMPLELVYPKQLLDRAMTQTKANLVITSPQYQQRVQDHPMIVLDGFEELLEACGVTTTNEDTPKPAFLPRPHADSLAFCVMSSGTTGTPKGICQTHRSAVHSYCDRFARYPYHRDAGTGQVQDRVGAGVFFVWEVYRPLCQGATAVIIPDSVIFDPEAVTQYIHSKQITRILFTPSLLQLVLDTIPPAVIQERCHQLRYMWLCGEVVTTQLAISFAKLLPDVELMNLYSISECHDVSIGDLRRQLDFNRKYATCGNRIPGVQFYIVSVEGDGGAMELVQDGGKGEVYVVCPVVGRGCLHLPEKTKERFVPNPFEVAVDDDGKRKYPRLYRTGDLGRLLPNSELEILGRCDFMVKIRGYSVVLGAVEAALAKHPKLCSAVVLPVGDEGTDKKLVAYVVPAQWDDAPSATSVRQFLKDHLPPYAIPSTFCVIDALPVNASAAGKLDRKKLPNHETAPRLRAFSVDITNTAANTTTSTTPAPVNDTEQVVLDTFATLLNIDANEISVTDNFFDIGGHSLLATKLVFMLNDGINNDENNSSNKERNKKISIIDVMQHPTAKDIAALLTNTENDNKNAATTPKIDLEAEAQTLDPSIYPFATRKGNTMSRFRIEEIFLVKPRVIFLTGATGYLGVHILNELLEGSQATVICLARAKTDADAYHRIVNNMKRYQLLPDDGDDEKKSENTNTTTALSLHNRMIGIAGDLSKPLLGLTTMQFKSLALEVDSIIHCGAEVNLLKPYASLKQSNVLGTQEILRLATTNGFITTKVKPVHYISTNGIFPVVADGYKNDDEVICKEDVDLNDPSIVNHLEEGYSMTKWVAERMCTIAEARGLPISIMRPGNMAGSITTGAQNPDDFNYLFLQAIMELKCAPISDRPMHLDLTPVDFAAKAIVQLAIHSPELSIGQRFHIQNPNPPIPLSRIVAWLREIFNTEIKEIPLQEWLQKLHSSNTKISNGWDAFQIYLESNLRYDTRNLVSMKGVPECPTISSSILKQW
eukprot:CAMPEP_0119545994 /NCGR_PEP_ID=MMETSP1352-20130426/585_1 /TAXON_ID=265584 /ORGANISM="Stauroneis constricta, Strain CCMP1120" /LENGTH=1098 /DNA_ID=CAMNT_0007590639 /DNA_START=60 /DNA_END=3353 /DNA_ORIENTATION=-